MSSEKAVEQVTCSMAEVSLSNGQAAEAEEAKMILICSDLKEATVVLVCRDGKEIYMDDETALMSEFLKEKLSYFRRCFDNGNDRVKLKLSGFDDLTCIPSEIASDLVEKAFRYCYCHAHPQPHQDLEAFDAQFYKDVINVSYSEYCRLYKAGTRFKIRRLMRLGFADLE